MYLIDPHCHLNSDDLVDHLPEVFASMYAQQAGQALVASVSWENFAETLAIAENDGRIFCTIGVHPDRRDAAEFSVTEMVARARHPKVISIDETGLDYYWRKGNLTWQHRCSADRIQVVSGAGLPMVACTHDATADTLRLPKECNTWVDVVHCFPGSVALIKAALDLGLYISFSDIVTFKNASLIQETTKYVPTDGMLAEADSPFLAPMPKRSKPNEPSYVQCTAESLTKPRGEILEQIVETTTKNFYRLFSKVPRIA